MIKHTMPELPEVEALRLGLVQTIIGSTIKKVTVLNAKLVSSNGTTRLPDLAKKLEFETILGDRKIVSINRRAKNLIFHLDNAALILVHLKMTGQLVFVPNSTNDTAVLGGHPIKESTEYLPNKHSYIIFELSNGKLFYNDVRQFGYVLFYPSQIHLDQKNHFENLGDEPLSSAFELNSFIEKLSKKHSPIKTVLLNQSVVVGCGNIYADESCFASGIKPTRLASSITKKEANNLYIQIIRILSLAVKSGGSSIANYLLADGTRGNYADFHQVYGRKGKLCLVCGQILQSTKIAGRTTVWCDFCQQ